MPRTPRAPSSPSLTPIASARRVGWSHYWQRSRGTGSEFIVEFVRFFPADGAGIGVFLLLGKCYILLIFVDDHQKADVMLVFCAPMAS